MGWTFYNSSGQQLKNTGATAITYLDIDGATDIGADIANGDLLIIDDGAGGTNRKTTVDRLKTYIGSAGVTREGGDTGENTSTSTSVANLTTASSLNILAASPFQYSVDGRRGTGASGCVAHGLTLTTSGGDSTIRVPTAATSGGLWATSSGDEVQSGGTWAHFGARVSNYLQNMTFLGKARRDNGGETNTVTNGGDNNAAFPTGAITDVDIIGITASASALVGADELQIHSFSAS